MSPVRSPWRNVARHMSTLAFHEPPRMTRFTSLPGLGGPRGSNRRTLLVVGWAINVLAPFRHVPVKIEKAPAIGLLFADGVGLLAALSANHECCRSLSGVPKSVGSVPPARQGIFPFGFGGQAITIRRVIAVPVRCFSL